MCITGYWHVRNLSREKIDALSEEVPSGRSSSALVEMAKEFQMILGAGLIEKSSGGKFYNSYVVAHPDGHVNCHRKIHCFISEDMSSGDAYTVFETHLGVKMGVLICYDNNLIENVRITALKGGYTVGSASDGRLRVRKPSWNETNRRQVMGKSKK